MNNKLFIWLMMLPFCSLSQNRIGKSMIKFRNLATNISHLSNADAGANWIPKGFSSHPGIDDLNCYNRNNAYFRLSTTVYFYEKFGFELAYQGNISTTENFNGFKSFIESKYASDYYIHYGSTVDKSNDAFRTDFFLVGPAFKFRYKKFYFLPKLLFGTMSFVPAEASVYLKKKDSNEYLTETYKPSRYNPSSFNMNAGLNIMYFFYQGMWGSMGVNMELNYYECRVNPKALVYTVTTTNLITGTEATNTVNYHQALRQFSVGLGISYYFKIGNVWMGK